jgi:hypothetical protein
MAGDNFHSVYMALEVLLIECKGCGRRKALTKPEAKNTIHQGNMKQVASQKFKCSKCGGTAVPTYIPHTQDQIDMFLAGDPVGTMRQAS